MLLQRSLEHDARVRREALALGAAGYRVTVLEVAPTGPEIPGIRRCAVLPGVAPLLPLRLRQAAMAAALIARVVRLRPDVVHAHDLLMLAPALVGARWTGARVVYDTHELSTGVPYRRGLVKLLADAIERVGIGRAAAVVTVSDAIADRLRSLYGLRRPPVVVRNLCALPRPSNGDGGRLRARLDLPDAPLVLHQGAVLGRRGCLTLVRALAQVPAAHLAFLGPCEPEFERRLWDEAGATGVADRVHVLPAVPLHELLAHTCDADVGVSLFEPSSENYRLTLPNKVFEYVAAGVPVVGSAVPEVERVVREHAIGWTVDPYDTGAVAAALREALQRREDAALRERLRAADAAFSWAEESGALVGLYRALAPFDASSAA